MASNPLHGRSREIADLEEALSLASEGRGRVVLLSGEAGIGKTRLAEEIAGTAERTGASVFWGRAWEGDGGAACLLWVQALRGCVRTEEGAAFIASDPRARTLAPLLAAASPADALEGEADRPELEPRALGRAIVALLDRLARTHPIVLVLDDLHASDLTSLELLHVVARELRGRRVLIIGTYRELEARRTPKMAALLVKIAREGAHRPLGGLDCDAVSDWIARVFAVAPAPSLVRAVFDATEGNPLFVDAISRLLAARGDGAALPVDFRLPDTVRETLEELLTPLSPSAREILDVASVLGRECDLRTLELVSERPLEVVLDAVREGVAAGALAGSENVRFAHVLTREAIYRALAAERRIAIHARAAKVLANQHLSDLDGHVAELAHHSFEGAPLASWIDAAELSTRAGLRAMGWLAFDDGARHLERALTALERAEVKDDGRTADLLWRLGLCRIRMGQGQAGRETCERSAALAARGDHLEIHARAALAFGAEAALGRVDARLVELLETALAIGAGNEALRVQVMARLAAAQVPTFASARPRELATEAIHSARHLGDRRVLAEVISTARPAFGPCDGLEERAALDRELFALAVGLGDKLLEVQAHSRLSLVLAEQGDRDAVGLELGAQRALADETRIPYHQLRASCTELLWWTSSADDEAIARIERDVAALADRVDDIPGLAVVEVNRCVRAETRGDLGAEAAALSALEGHVAREPSLARWFRIWRCRARPSEHDADEARARVQEFAPQGSHRALGHLLAIVAPIVVRLGDRDEIELVYDSMLPFASRQTIFPRLFVCLGPVAYPLGTLAAALGRTEDAAAHFEEAASRSARAGFVEFEARARRAHASLGRPDMRPVRADAVPRLSRDGELWILALEGRQARLKDSRGLHYLAALLREPGREIHVGDLIRLASGGLPREHGDAGALLDAQATAAYRQRLADLADAREDARERGDGEAIARLDQERDAIAAELARAVGLGGRARRAGAASERARINVQRRLRDVVKRVSELDSVLGRHLELHLRTGVFCSWKV